MFTNLRYIDLSFSNIQKVEEFAFDENRKLETILISSNNIKSLPNLFNNNDNALSKIEIPIIWEYLLPWAMDQDLGFPLELVYSKQESKYFSQKCLSLIPIPK